MPSHAAPFHPRVTPSFAAAPRPFSSFVPPSSSRDDLDSSARSADSVAPPSSPNATPPLSTSPLRRTVAEVSPHSSSCRDSYRLFKRCSDGARGTEGLSCGAAVASYLRCAMNPGR